VINKELKIEIPFLAVFRDLSVVFPVALKKLFRKSKNEKNILLETNL